MKKCILIGLIFFFCSLFISATEYTNLLFFTGIGTRYDDDTYYSDDTNSDVIGIEDQAKKMWEKYWLLPDEAYDKDKPYINNYPKVIIGQSQGGVRALGFASKYPDSTKAVITIGAPVKGHPMLLSIGYTKQQITSGINTITYGAAGVVPILGSIVVAGMQALAEDNGLGTTFTDQIVNLLINFKFKKDDINVWAILNMASNSSTTAYPGISDLAPNSAFITKYIAPGTNISMKTVKLQTGTKTALVITGYKVESFLGITWKVPIYAWVTTPIYAIFQLPVATVVPKIDPDVYLHFVRGTQNDPVSFLSPEGQVTARDAIKTYCDVTNTAGYIYDGLAVAATVAAVANYAFLNIPAGIQFTAAAVVAVDSATKCHAGYNWVNNYKTNIGHILGGTENDSFIPYNAQYWDSGAIGGKQLGSMLASDYVLNHDTELKDPQIWGAKGSMTSATAYQDGALATLLKKLPHESFSKLDPEAVDDNNYSQKIGTN